jgi:uridine phosphorylase
MSGLLVGNPCKTESGDVVVVSKAVDIDGGIASDRGFQPRVEIFNLTASMKAHVELIDLPVSDVSSFRFS